MNFKYNKKEMINNVILIVFLMFCINVTYSIFRFKFYTWLPLVIDFILIFIYLCRYEKLKLRRIYYEMVREFFLPLIIPSIFAAATAIFIYHNPRYTMSSFKYVLWVYGAYLFGYFLVCKFRLKAFYLFLVAGSISYFTVICKAIIKHEYGLLEVHEMTYIYGMLFIFFLLYKDISKNKKRLACIICLIGMILGDKRALWLALLVALVTYYLFFIILNNKKRGLKFVCLITLILTFAWVWVIKSGYFELICLKYGINDMSRLKMWNYFNKDYSFSPLYFGRGLTYTDVVMDQVHDQLHITTAIPIHNCILKMYIGWGFLPFAYYIFYFVHVRVAKLLKTGNKNNAWLFLSVTLLFLIINFLGDTLFNIGISMLYAMIWTFLKNPDNKPNTMELERNRE